MAEALRRGMSIDKVAELTDWDTFFVQKLKNILDMEAALRTQDIDPDLIRSAKRMGFSDEAIGSISQKGKMVIREERKAQNIIPTYKMVDTCAAEFKAETPYFYSTYEKENEALPIKDKKVVIVGAGPIRIGQGIEFDYACVHGVLALQEEGVKAVIVNNNPETVSTDYDISNRLYFEPLTLEDIYERDRERRC